MFMFYVKSYIPGIINVIESQYLNDIQTLNLYDYFEFCICVCMHSLS